MILSQEFDTVEFEPETRYVRELYSFCESNGIEIDTLRDGKVRLKFLDHVGFIKIGKNQINIRPKIPLASFLYVLARSSMGMKTLPKNLIQTGSDVEEFNVIRIFTSLLRGFLKIGVGSEYVIIHEKRSDIQGQIDFSDINAYYPWNVGNLPCIYDDFLIDNIYNQIIRLTLHRLKVASIKLDKSSFKEILNLEERLRRISLKTRIDLSSIDLILNKLPKRFEYYKPMLMLCKLILSGLSISEKGKSIHITGFILRMNILYESFIFTLTKLYMPNYAITSNKYVIQSVSGNVRHLLFYKPDLVAKDIGNLPPVLIGDAKYKFLNYNKERMKIQSDFYQILSYCLFMKSKKGVLFYPNPSSTQNSPIVFRLEEYGVEIWIVSLQLGGYDWVHLDHKVKSLFDEIKEWILDEQIITN